MRLFAAVVPPPEVLEHLELALRTVRGDHGRRGTLRWSEPGDRHLTLAFYGDVPEGYLDEITRALDDVAGTTAPFRLALRGAGVFDGRTVWIGLAGDVGALHTLMGGAASVGAEVLRREPDQRSRAHLTVARVRSRCGARGSGTGPGAPAALAHALAVYQGPGWTVRDVVLMASDLGGGRGGAPRYDVVHRSPLAAVAG